ncbi:hypothetical protein ACFWMS_23565 [Peribacillus butanolivorans]|uniref:hypothetical protein n=1 Tax=Peribacillus butanolivorans TaxID=421767 RepID=UPI0036474AD9
MANDKFTEYQKLLDSIEKQKKQTQVIEDHVKAVQLRKNTQIDFRKNNPLRRERTHRLVQKGALFEKYIEEHLGESISSHLEPEESEILLDVLSDILKKNKPYIMNQLKIKKQKKKEAHPKE